MPWGRADARPWDVAVLGSLRKLFGPTGPVLATAICGHVTMHPMDGDFPFNSQASTAEERAALLCSSPPGSGEKGEGGCPELLLYPAPVFISSSPSGLMWPDSPHDPSTGNVAAATDVFHEGAGSDSAKASSRWEDARVTFQKLSSYLFCHFCSGHPPFL